MTTKRDILQPLEGLPTAALEQVKDFIIFLKATKGRRQPPLTGKALAKRQAVIIRKWADANLGPGFSGKEHDAVECLAEDEKLSEGNLPCRYYIKKK